MRKSFISGTKVAAFVGAVALAASLSIVTFAAPNTGSGSGQTPECQAKINACKKACIVRYRGNPNLITDCRNNCAKMTCVAGQARPAMP